MWSLEIESVLSNHKNFMGFFPINDLPQPPTPNSKSFYKSFIINTSPSTEEGEHWVTLVIKNKNCYYFDSFGLPIISFKLFQFLNNFRKVSYSDVSLQHHSSTLCGKFCIAFIKYVRSRNSYLKFLSMFDFVNLLHNDVLIESIFKKINLRISKIDKKFSEMSKAPSTITLPSSFLSSRRKVQKGKGIRKYKRKRKNIKFKSKKQKKRRRIRRKRMKK